MRKFRHPFFSTLLGAHDDRPAFWLSGLFGPGILRWIILARILTSRRIVMTALAISFCSLLISLCSFVFSVQHLRRSFRPIVSAMVKTHQASNVLIAYDLVVLNSGTLPARNIEISA